MKVYIVQNKDGEFASVNFAVAYDGFRKMGWESVTFSRQDNTRLANLTPEDVVVGYIEDVNAAFAQLCIEAPVEINYPDELTCFLGRKIWKSRINYIAKHPEAWNVFIKPATLSKKFTGRLVRSPKRMFGKSNCYVFSGQIPLLGATHAVDERSEACRQTETSARLHPLNPP